jgi:hypothetical protein
MTASQETIATSGDSRTYEIPVAERTSTTVGTHAGNSKEQNKS